MDEGLLTARAPDNLIIRFSRTMLDSFVQQWNSGEIYIRGSRAVLEWREGGDWGHGPEAELVLTLQRADEERAHITEPAPTTAP